MLSIFVTTLLFAGLTYHVSSFASFGVFYPPQRRYHYHHPQATTTTTTTTSLWNANNNDNNNANNNPPNKKNKKGGYKFGDITKSIGRKITGDENYQFGDITKNAGKSLTGKDEYQFGDISRWLDSKAKSAVNSVTGKDDYEFGDLTKYLDERAKSSVNSFTKKDEYVVGDISKEVVRRAWSGEYELKDMILLLKVLASFGVTTCSPVAGMLPVKMLLDAYNVSLEVEIGGRITEILAMALDRRFKEALTGDANYQLGDKTKEKIMSFMGKNVNEGEHYEFGDFSRAVKQKMEVQQQQKQATQQQQQQLPQGGSSTENVIDVTAVVEPILDAETIVDLNKFDQEWKKQNMKEA